MEDSAIEIRAICAGKTPYECSKELQTELGHKPKTKPAPKEQGPSWDSLKNRFLHLLSGFGYRSADEK